jgi:oligosaccharide repeat unit polymerase
VARPTDEQHGKFLMAVAFCLALLAYYSLVLRTPSMRGAALSRVLWAFYLALGLAGSVILLADGIPTVYPPNYLSTLFLTACVLLCIWAFGEVRDIDIARFRPTHSIVRPIENVLIASQLFSIVYFLPFALAALQGDPRAIRFDMAETMERLAAYGLVNTFAGHASHLFTASLALAFLRLGAADGTGRNLVRAGLLALASLSWVIYVLAYAGRDGVIFWGMNAIALYFLFRLRMAPRDRTRVVAVVPIVGAALLVPMFIITVARSFMGDGGGFWSLFEYFGAQVQNFSDYSSLERPRTNGLRTLPLFHSLACNLVGAQCETWPDIQGEVFDAYLLQGKEPWLFGTFVSDLVGDFGYLGTFVAVGLFAAVARIVCGYRRRGKSMSLSRLFFILLLFQIPFWGVFYFRLSIANGYLVVNAALCLAVFLLERIAGAKRRKLVRDVQQKPASMNVDVR